MTRVDLAPRHWLIGLFCCALGPLALLGGCGGGSCGDLGGTATTNYEAICGYESVIVQRQEQADGTPVAMRVGYVRNVDGMFEWLVRVIAVWPVQQGQEHDLVDDGSVEHISSGGGQFPPVQSGYVKFTSLGDVGENAAGEFFATFEGGEITINGTFSETVQRLAPE